MENSLKTFLRLFQIFGSSTLHCHSHNLSKPNIWFITLTCFHLCFSFSLVATLIILRDDIIGPHTPSSIVNEYLQVFSPLFIYLFAVLEGLYYCKRESVIWCNVIKCENLCNNLQPDVNDKYNNIFKINFTLICALYTIVPFIPECYNLIFIPYPKWQRSYMIRIWPFVNARINHLYYLFYIYFLKTKIDFISVVVQQNQVTGGEQIKKIHSCLWKICYDMSERFGLSETANLLNQFLLGMVSSYWIFVRLVYLPKYPIICKY